MNMNAKEIYTLIEHQIIPVAFISEWNNRGKSLVNPTKHLEGLLSKETRYTLLAEQSLAIYAMVTVGCLSLTAHFSGNIALYAIISITALFLLACLTVRFALITAVVRKELLNHPLVVDLNSLMLTLGCFYWGEIARYHSNLQDSATEVLREKARSILSLRLQTGEASTYTLRALEDFSTAHRLFIKFDLAEESDKSYFEGHKLEDVQNTGQKSVGKDEVPSTTATAS